MQNNNYTWQIISRDSNSTYTFAPLVSTGSAYYNQFTFSIGGLDVRTGSVIELDLELGEYHYYIYQTTNQYDLSLASNLGLVEIGLLRVIGTSSSWSIFTASDDDTIKVFTEL